jgi:hypothetical protein
MDEIKLGTARDAKVRDLAAKALEGSDFSEVFETVGMEDSYETAGAALRTVLAEKLADCTLKAIKEAKRRKMRLGAATVILAAQGIR